MKGKHFFTSEAVGMGHPDKVSDQVSDAILDAFIAQDPNSRVAVETLVTTGIVVTAGEVTSTGHIEVADVVREMVKEIGYNDPEMGFDYRSCGVVNLIHGQSPDISQGVTEGLGLHAEQGAGDQGIMFGYACTETEQLMPLPITLSHQLMQALNQLRASGEIPYLRPDAKSQVTVEYDGDTPVRVDTVVISTQHAPEATHEKITGDITEKLIRKIIPADYVKGDLRIHVNPTGRFVVGGPHGDSGVTGRKIIVDTYGGKGSHGGGAFSGKDPSKVDRSGTYFARYIAKNLVAAGIASSCEVQLAYAIGVADPVSVLVDTNDSGKLEDEKIATIVREHFDMRPRAMIQKLNLLRPIYRETAKHGHFGHTGDGFTWERTDMADALRKAAGL